MKKTIFYLLALSVVLVPSFAFAKINSVGLDALKGPIISCVGNYADSSIATVSNPSNLPPCTSLCNLIQTAANIIYFGISVALFIIMPILFAWGGLMFMFSRGKPDGISKAKSILTGAVVGLLIVLGAWLIVNTAVTVLGITGFVGGFGTNACTNAPSSQINVPSSQNSPQNINGD